MLFLALAFAKPLSLSALIGCDVLGGVWSRAGSRAGSSGRYCEAGVELAVGFKVALAVQLAAGPKRFLLLLLKSVIWVDPRSQRRLLLLVRKTPRRDGVG